MSGKVEPKTLKGFKDYLPQEQRLRLKIIDTCREVFELYGFLPLDTPALEYAETLGSKIGEDEKLIYKFEDRGGREVALRYDLTVSLARVVAQYQNEIKLPFRRYQIGSVWRADNTQKGRYREFMQADVDIVGTDSITADAEAVGIYYEVFSRLKIPDFVIYINNREVFNELRKELEISDKQITEVIRAIDKLDKIGLDGVIELFSKAGLSGDQIEKLKSFLNSKNVSNAYFENLKQILDVAGIPASAYEFKPSLARGLDYYTGIVLEAGIKNSDFGSFGGAGRYDDLVAQFLGKKIPAVGLSVGVDRLLAYMLEKEMFKDGAGTKVLVMNLGNEFSSRSIEVLSKLRKSGIPSEYFYDNKDLDKQFKYAEYIGAAYGILIGEQEIKSGKVTIRDLNTRTQEEKTAEEAVEFFKKA